MTDVKSFLKKYQGRKIKYIPNSGNAGDSLIGLATLQRHEEVDLDYEICKHTEIDKAAPKLSRGG